MSQLCDVCETPTSLVCNKCEHSFYCSQKCQTLDFHKHKHICDEFIDDELVVEPEAGWKKDRFNRKMGEYKQKKQRSKEYIEAKKKLVQRQKEEMRALRLKQKEERQDLKSHWSRVINR